MEPFELLDQRDGGIAYRLVVPPHLHKTHDVLHVSILLRYIVNEYHKLNWKEL